MEWTLRFHEYTFVITASPAFFIISSSQNQSSSSVILSDGERPSRRACPELAEGTSWKVHELLQ